MLSSIKTIGRLIIPPVIFKALQPYYHGTNAWLADIYYGRPSKQLVVIGVTGTAGKSTTINALARILNTSGKITGFSTTTNYSDGKTEVLNKHGLSMPNGWMLHRQLRQMIRNGCTHAIVECTSEGLAQNRHRGIRFDLALLTNLSPAHLDAHGNFENYRAAKGLLFDALHHSRRKPASPKKIIGVNGDDDNAPFFLNFSADKKFSVTLNGNAAPKGATVNYAASLISTEPHIEFTLAETRFVIPMIGQFNAYNITLAVAAAAELGVELKTSAAALRSLTSVPGRMEKIKNNIGATIIVDYACEPQPMQACLDAVSELPHKKLVHVFGATGGHRDISKRFSFGESSVRRADTIIITNDDVYDSDPQTIADNIMEGIERVPATERRATEIMTILDRRHAIRKALSITQPGDILLITGKGSEQFLSLPGNKRIEWDDRAVVTQELSNL